MLSALASSLSLEGGGDGTGVGGDRQGNNTDRWTQRMSFCGQISLQSTGRSFPCCPPAESSGKLVLGIGALARNLCKRSIQLTRRFSCLDNSSIMLSWAIITSVSITCFEICRCETDNPEELLGTGKILKTLRPAQTFKCWWPLIYP